MSDTMLISVTGINSPKNACDRLSQAFAFIEIFIVAL